MAAWVLDGVERVHVASGGNVDIGTVNPTAKLLVRGSIRTTGDLVLESANCADPFGANPTATVEPDTVMASADHGDVAESRQPRERRIAGAVTGTGHAP